MFEVIMTIYVLGLLGSWMAMYQTGIRKKYHIIHGGKMVALFGALILASIWPVLIIAKVFYKLMD